MKPRRTVFRIGFGVAILGALLILAWQLWLRPVPPVQPAIPVVQAASSDHDAVQNDGNYTLGGPALAVGDPAPGLAVQEFLRGPAVTGFERGTVYVLEFWKVGCPPCRAAIPHLNELQQRHPAVVFISVGVISSTADNVAYVKRTGDQMKYRVAVDRVPPGKDAITCGAMVQAWLEPAGEEGVPTSFIIDGNGRIAWIGHPTELDEAKAGRPLHEVVARTWDLKTAAVKFAGSRGADARRRIDQLPKTERDAVHALHERAGRVEVVIRGNTVTWVRFDPRRVTDAVIADLATDLRKLNGLWRLDLCGADISDAGLKALRELTTVTSLDISCTRVTDAGLAHLRGWNDLRALNLRGTRVTGVGLKELGAKPKLATLILSETPSTAAGLKTLKDFPELHVLHLSRCGLNDDRLGELQGMGLRGLDLSGNPITDAGLIALKGMTLGHLSLANTRVEGTGLTELRDLVQGGLNLSGTRVTDTALAELMRFPDLRRLVLDGTRVTDAGLAGLSQNRELRSLSLTDTQVTDGGLANFAGMTKLGTLELGGTGVSDDGLRELERHKALTFLDVARTKVTKAGVDGLRAALPHLQIAY